MNIINKLTIKHLKQNKRRTIVTIIGVIISVSMITAVATLAMSTLEMFQKSTQNYTGDWQVNYREVPAENVSIIENNRNTDHVIIEDELGFAKLSQENEKNRPYLYVTAVNQAGFEDLPLALTKGKLPQTKEEIVVSDQVKGIEVGDQITLKMGKRVSTDEYRNGEELGNTPQEPYNLKEETFVERETKTYTVTGLINTDLMKHSSASNMAYSIIGSLTGNAQFNVKVGLKKIDRSLYEDSEILSKSLGNGAVDYNHELLKFYGVTDNIDVQNMLMILVIIVGLIILIGSVVLIYNAFMISLSERSRHLGMLASIGATKRQKRNSVFYEGFIVGIIAIPLGLIAGIVGMGLSLQLINPMLKNVFESTEDIKVVISPLAIMGAVIFSSLTILISTWIPALKASRISPIDGIRQTKHFHPKNKRIRTSKLVRTLFGFEAELGLKNIKRNRQRYLATLFSMVMSIVLFLSTVTFTHLMSSSLQMTLENTKADLEVTIHNPDEVPDLEAYLKRYTEINKVDEIVEVELFTASVKLGEGQLHPKIKKHVMETTGQFEIGLNVISLDDEAMNEIYQEAAIDKTRFEDQEIGGILFDRVAFHHKKSYEELNISSLKAQDEVPIYQYDPRVEQEKLSQTIKLSQTSDYSLPYVDYTQEYPELTIVVSKQTMNEIVGRLTLEQQYQHSYRLLIQTKDAGFVEEQLNDLVIEYPDASMTMFNAQASKQRGEEVNLLVTFFVFSFIGLITLISIVSISNTLTTSIHLRKREFAMLKSVGLTPQGFSEMIRFESLFYGLKALLYGLPISFLVMYLLYQVMNGQFDSGLYIPWLSILGVVIVVFTLTSMLMFYSTKKMKMDSVVEALKNENM